MKSFHQDNPLILSYEEEIHVYYFSLHETKYHPTKMVLVDLSLHEKRDPQGRCEQRRNHISPVRSGSGVVKEDYSRMFFLFLYKNICCGYSLEAPRRGASNEYPQHTFLWRIRENYLGIIVKYTSLTTPLTVFLLYLLYQRFSKQTAQALIRLDGYAV